MLLKQPMGHADTHAGRRTPIAGGTRSSEERVRNFQISIHDVEFRLHHFRVFRFHSE
jgi:hypothetical protein